MNEVLNNPTKLRELRQQAQGRVTDEQFDEYLRQKGVSDDIIQQSKITQPTPPEAPMQQQSLELTQPAIDSTQQPTQQLATTEPVSPVEPTQLQAPSVVNTPDTQPQKPTLDKLKSVWNQARGKVTSEQMIQKGKELGFSDKDMSFVKDKFEMLDDTKFESYLDRLAKGAKPTDILQQDTQALLNESSTLNQANAAYEEAVRNLVNFYITRDVMRLSSAGKRMSLGQSDKYLRQKYPNLTDNDIANLKKAFKEFKIDNVKALSNTGSALLEGVEQDFLKVKKFLSMTGLVDFTQQDLEEQKKLETLERKREILDGSFMGLDISDLASPIDWSLLLLDPFKKVEYGAKGAKVGWEVLKSATMGGTLGLIQSLESDATNTQKVSGALFGALSQFIPATLQKSAEKGFKFFSNLSFSKDTMLKDLGNTLGDMKIQDFMNFLKFADENGYKLNIGALTQPNSQTYNVVMVGKAYSKLLTTTMADTLHYDNVIVNRAMKKTVEDLDKSDVIPKIANVKDAEGKSQQVIDDYVQTLLQKNIQEFEVKLKTEMDKAYADSAVVSSSIPITKPEDTMYDLLRYRERPNMPITIEGTPSENLKSALDEYVFNAFDTKKISGNYTLEFLQNLRKGINQKFPVTSDKERNLIVAQFKAQLDEVQLGILNDLQTNLSSKASLSPVEQALQDKLPQAIELQQKAKDSFLKEVAYLRDSNAKEYIGNFINDKGAEILNKTLNSANLQNLASLKTAFSSVGKEEEFKALGKRYVVNKLKGLYDTTLDKADYSRLSKQLGDLLEDKNRLELFGFTDESIQALKNMRILADFHLNLKRLLSSGLDTTVGQIGLLRRLTTNLPDTLRGIIVSKTNPDNAKIIEIAKKLQENADKINDIINRNPELQKRVRSYAARFVRGAVAEGIREGGEALTSPSQ